MLHQLREDLFKRGHVHQIAQAVWNLIPLASRTVTVTTNSDKAGYGGAVKSIQHGTISFGTNEQLTNRTDEPVGGC